MLGVCFVRVQSDPFSSIVCAEREMHFLVNSRFEIFNFEPKRQCNTYHGLQLFQMIWKRFRSPHYLVEVGSHKSMMAISAFIIV